MSNREELIKKLNRFEMFVRASQLAKCSMSEDKSIIEMGRLCGEYKDREIDVEMTRADVVSFFENIGE